ncbi:MAG: hypothetical protein R3251_03050 [Candidatus Spechtbacterales bacterium]|nr:hypothetical protein [Candidatus Spechtbacterales bacterium]
MRIVRGGIEALNAVDTNLVLLHNFQTTHRDVYMPVDILEYAPDIKDMVQWIYGKAKNSHNVAWFMRFPQSSSEATYVLMNIICSVFNRIIEEHENRDSSVFSGTTLVVENEKEYIFDYLTKNLPGAKMSE